MSQRRVSDSTRSRPMASAPSWVLLWALTGTSCSTQVPHPLLNDETAARATAIDLAQPPTTQTEPKAKPESKAKPAPGPDKAPAVRAPVAAKDAGATATPSKPATLQPTAPVKPPVAADPNVPLASRVEERLELTIADVRSQALSNNLEIKTELVRPSLLREDRRVAEARFLPTAFARYSYSTFDEPAVAPTRNANKTTTDNAELGFIVPLQTGGEARISMPLTRTDFGIKGVENVHDAAAALSLTQPLLRDAGRGVNLAPITIARLQERQQDAQTKLAILNVLAGSERAYWDLYAASRTVQVRLEQYARAQEQERQAARLAEEGVVPAIEVVRARAGVARRIDDIISSENTRRRVEREIKRVLNRPDLPVSGTATVMVTTQPDPFEIVVDRAAALSEARTNRMELLSLELQLAVDALTVKVTRNQKLPRLALDYSFRYLGAANELSEALQLIGKKDFADQTIGLTLEVPLGNQAREARHNRAALQQVLTSANRAQQEQLIERQVLDAIDQLDEAWQRILAAREETLLAARNYQAEQRQFIAGVRTSTDVLQAADFLADAQIRELNALSAYEVAKIGIAFVTGTLLGSGRIQIESFDETHDIEALADGGLDDFAAQSPVAVRPAQESIKRKLDQLGVKAPSAAQATGVTPTPLPSSPVAKPAPAPVPETKVESTPAVGNAGVPESAAASTQVRVNANDTLWSLAAAHRPSPDVSVQQMMSALMSANPEHFPNRAPETLNAGVALRLPTDAEIQTARGSSPSN